MSLNSKPVIGIVPCFDEGVRIPYGGGSIKRLYLRHEYDFMLAQVGAVPLILNPDMELDDIASLCDGLVISGGEDIHPSTYGQEPIEGLRHTEPLARFEWERELIVRCDEANIPILGICYGLQRLNVHYGGTLLQDIPTLRPDNVGHDVTGHEVLFHGDFLGMKATGTHIVASRHHQAIDLLAEGFEVRAEAPDGIIEAIEGHGHFGMQWHPESDATGAHVYRAFVEHCVPSAEGE